MKQLLNTLYVSTEGAWLRLEGETLVVMIEKEKRLQVPLHHLGGIVCIGRVNLSSALMARCMEDGRSIVWLNENGRFQARVEGAVSGNILLRQAQFRASEDASRTFELARAFVAGKLRNSRQVLLRSARDSASEDDAKALRAAAEALAVSLRNLKTAPDLNGIRGLEGEAARTYFDHVNRMLRPQVRGEFEYAGRTRRPPRDPVNALLSFLYALLLIDCRSALESVGLDSQLGYLHAVRPGRHSLALDLLEEFRAVLGDRMAITLINRGQLTRKDFDFNPGGSVLLNDSGRKKVLVAYQERKKESLTHPVLEEKVPIGLLPILQARFLARHLRGDTEAYIPYLHK